jgi:hypothetical protein
MGGQGSGLTKPTQKYELTREETSANVDSLLKDEDVKLYLAMKRGETKFAMAQAYENAWKAKQQIAREIEPRQPVRNPIQREQIQEEESQDEGYEEQ